MVRKTFSNITGKSEQQVLNEALRKAAMKGQLIRVQRLMDLGADIDYRDAKGRTPLCLAAARGHASVVHVLERRKEELLEKEFQSAVQKAVILQKDLPVPKSPFFKPKPRQ